MESRCCIAALGLGAVVVALSLGAAAPAAAQYEETQILVAEDGESDDLFGIDVALDGDFALVGAYAEDEAEGRAGAVYFFQRIGGNWVQRQKLTASDAAVYDEFGYSLAMAGERAVIGAPRDDDAGNEAGGAYVFEFNGTRWREVQQLHASDGRDRQIFGAAVAFDGETIVVGAPTFGDEPGAAYVFEHDGTRWVETQILTGPGVADGGFFGAFRSLAVDGDAILVGAERHTLEGFDGTGAVFAFTRGFGRWNLTDELAPEESEFLGFGRGIALEGTTAVVATSSTDNVFVFRREGFGWHEEQELHPSDPCGDWLPDGFGSSLSYSCGTLAVGAMYHCANGDSSGQVYVFRRDGGGFQEVQKFAGSDTAYNHRFGTDVAVSGRSILGAAILGSAGAPRAGAAYVRETDELLLGIDPHRAEPGDPVDFTTCGGDAATLAVLYAVDVDDVPVFLAVGRGRFDPTGNWLLQRRLPDDPALSGHRIEFQTFNIDAGRRLVLSHRAPLIIE